jgi:hypothetical protein
MYMGVYITTDDDGEVLNTYWNRNIIPTYTRNIMKVYLHSLPVLSPGQWDTIHDNWDGSKYDYDGYGDTIQIVEILPTQSFRI